MFCTHCLWCFQIVEKSYIVTEGSSSLQMTGYIVKSLKVLMLDRLKINLNTHKLCTCVFKNQMAMQVFFLPAMGEVRTRYKVMVMA